MRHKHLPITTCACADTNGWNGNLLRDQFRQSRRDSLKHKAESAGFFKNSYGYAVFPTIGKAGLGIGGAHGSGCVYKQGKQVGTAKMNQVSFGWQAGAQGYSLLVFFEDERAFKEFTSGNFEFGAKASAGAITAGASAAAGSTGPASHSAKALGMRGRLAVGRMYFVGRKPGGAG